MQAFCSGHCWHCLIVFSGVAHTMPEKFTLSQAAARIGVSRRTLYNWLQGEPDLARILPTDKRARWLTQGQIESLAKKHGRQVDKNAALEALAARVESHDALLEEYE